MVDFESIKLDARFPALTLSLRSSNFQTAGTSLSTISNSNFWTCLFILVRRSSKTSRLCGENAPALSNSGVSSSNFHIIPHTSGTGVLELACWIFTEVLEWGHDFFTDEISKFLLSIVKNGINNRRKRPWKDPLLGFDLSAGSFNYKYPSVSAAAIQYGHEDSLRAFRWN